MKSPIQAYLESLHARLGAEDGGHVADYIPELGKVAPELFGICLVSMDGAAYCVGDFEQAFTIQSISKAFVYATALADKGKEYVARKVGVEPSGDAFNSISLQPKTGAPFNPMINAGAIATTSLVRGENTAAQWQRIETSLAAFMGHDPDVDEAVCLSESETGHRNRAIAWMLKNFGIIEGDPMASVENYFRQCSVLVNCRDLAYMAATLANGGVHPLTGKRAMPAEHVKHVLSVMATCGMYDYAGSWLYEVGLPAKSGVGGGIIAVLPGHFGIAVFSPRLDEKGNSVRGIEVCKHLSRELGLNMFNPEHDPAMALGRVYSGADAPSRRKASPEMAACLKEGSHGIKYLCLHGFLGVASIEFVMRKMQGLAAEANSFILDMHQVDGITESAARLLNQARLGFCEEGIAVVFSRIHRRPGILKPLSKAAGSSDCGFLSFEDNDLAVEWCENRLLDGAQVARASGTSGLLSEAALFQGLPPALLGQIEAVSRAQSYAAGDQIIVSGQAGDGRIFFIETGQVSILVPLKDGAHHRIATLGAGMVFGEMVLLGQATRSASVYADSAVVCRIIEAGDLDGISAQNPQLKIILLQNLAGDLANTLRRATQWIAALA